MAASSPCCIRRPTCCRSWRCSRPPAVRARELTDTMKPGFTAHDWIAPKIVEVPSSHGAGNIYAKYYGPADERAGIRGRR